jgi:hypothetical protein
MSDLILALILAGQLIAVGPPQTKGDDSAALQDARDYRDKWIATMTKAEVSFEDSGIETWLERSELDDILKDLKFVNDADDPRTKEVGRAEDRVEKSLGTLREWDAMLESNRWRVI